MKYSQRVHRAIRRWNRMYARFVRNRLSEMRILDAWNRFDAAVRAEGHNAGEMVLSGRGRPPKKGV